MSRIFVLGAAPLPFEPERRQYAANLRTWHFTRPLLADGHQVRLVAGRLPETYPASTEPIRRTTDGALEYYSLAADLFHDTAYLQELADGFEPDGILGVNTHPASRAVRIATEVPIWCDLNGWIMAEAQTKCHIYDDDQYLSHFWKMEEAILDRADVISTVSLAQANATIGELATRGRLGKANFGFTFVHPIPNAVSEVEYLHRKTVFRGAQVAEGAFVVLWAGGYNTWTDVDLLYDALTRAMAAVDELCFVSTGGTIAGHDEITFDRFVARARESRFRDRFHFAGWVPTEDVPCYYFESNLGINVDSDNYETVFGARNRLNDMMKAGLAVLTTTGTEIAATIAENQIGLTCAPSDPAAFAERLIWAARHPEELEEIGRSGRAYVHEAFSYARTTGPMRAWAAAPYRAPDRGLRVEFEDIDYFRPPSEDAAEEPQADSTPGFGLPEEDRKTRQTEQRLAELEARYHQVRGELGEIHESKMWRLWMAYLGVRRRLLRLTGRS